MEEKSRRIVESAMELAEQGGFEAVRLRDVALKADVALGTLYKRFRSKEDVLAAVLEVQAQDLALRLMRKPITGKTPADRVTAFYRIITRQMCSKPHLTKAVLRAVASGEPASAVVLGFQDRASSFVTVALQGDGAEGLPEKQLKVVAGILQDVWFASLVGWMGGLHKESVVTRQVGAAARLLVRGLRES